MKKMISSIAFPLLTFAGFSFPAHADGTAVNCERSNTNFPSYYQYFSNVTLQVGKDAVPGDLLGSWSSSFNPSAWTCSHLAGSQNLTVPMSTQGYPPYPAWGQTQTDGQVYTVYQTTVKPGLGYIARWRYTIKGQTSDWYPLTIAAGGQQTGSQFFNVQYDPNVPRWNFGLDVQIRLVKISSALTAGPVSQFDPIYVRHYQTPPNSGAFAGSGTYMIAAFIGGGLTIQPNTGTCTTSNVAVTLPSVGRSEFTGIGFSTARTDFSLNLNKCPKGLASISYLFTPTTSILDNTNGIFSLDSTSTASGVGLQLLNKQDNPLNFNNNYLLSDYDPSVDNANYTVPLRVGLYQTNNSVSSGSVNGAVTFTLSYK